jgi:hypothetical protein
VLREDHHADVWVVFSNGVRGFDSLHMVAGRHPDVRDDDVRVQASDGVQGRSSPPSYR